ncbi:MAG: tripartite tricarboxylate transporter TctB family protein [Candidatus Binatia bacterium]
MKRSAVWSIFAAFALLAFHEAGKLPFGSMNAPGAGFFPIVLAGLLAAISLIGLVATLRGNGAQEGHEAGVVWRKIFLMVMSLLIFASIFEFAGYLVTTFLFILFLLRAVERKSWTQAGAVALCASLASYIIFGRLLGAPLPAGFLPV